MKHIERVNYQATAWNRCLSPQPTYYSQSHHQPTYASQRGSTLYIRLKEATNSLDGPLRATSSLHTPPRWVLHSTYASERPPPACIRLPERFYTLHTPQRGHLQSRWASQRGSTLYIRLREAMTHHWWVKKVNFF